MKILGLKAENVKRIEVAEIDTKGESVIVTGQNGNGKSSVLDSILLALQNTGSATLRHGAKKGEVTLDLGELTVQRRLTEKGSYISVTAKDGDRVKSPQAVLDKLVGNLALDPLAFQRMDARTQRETLLAAAGIDVSELDKREKQAYDERRDANRDLKSAQAELDAHPEPKDAPHEPVDVDALFEKQEEIAGEIQQADEAENELRRAIGQADIARGEVARLERELAEAKKSVETYEKIVEEKRKAIPDTSPLREHLEEVTDQLRNATKMNEAYAGVAKHHEKKKLWEERKSEAEAAEKHLEAIRAERMKAIESADFGVPGLSVDDDGITVDDVPFQSLSSAVQIKVATALAMAANPTLKVIMIREGSFLDSNGLRAIQELAAEGDYQLWIEKVQDSPGEVGVHMVEGRIIAVNGQPHAPPHPKVKEEAKAANQGGDDDEEFDLE